MITKAQRDHKASTKTRSKASHSQLNHLIERGSQTAYNRKLGYHDSCTLCKGSGLYPRVVISLLAKRLEKPLFCHSLLFLWCMAQRSLHAITKVYYRSLSCFAMVYWTNNPLLVVLRFHAQASPLASCGSGDSQSMKSFSLNRARHTTYSSPN
jgi:hypothetical protein